MWFFNGIKVFRGELIKCENLKLNFKLVFIGYMMWVLK